MGHRGDGEISETSLVRAGMGLPEVLVELDGEELVTKRKHTLSRVVLSVCAASVGAGALAAAIAVDTAKAQDSSSACIGQLMLFGGNFCPRGYAEANGDLIPIASNSALFAVLGTTYGGNGTTNFALPDLRGRAPLGQGNGPNLPPAVQGSLVGAPTVTLTEDQLAPHSHSLGGNAGSPVISQPEGKSLAGANIYNSNPPLSALSAQSIGKTGKGAPIPIQSPAQVIRWCVATQGIFCSRP